MEENTFSSCSLKLDLLNGDEITSDQNFEDFSHKREIGKGSYGKVFEVSLPHNIKKTYAAKEAYSPDNSPKRSELSKEKKILDALSDVEGFPKALNLIRKNQNEILLMTLLGKNLKELYNESGRRFSLKTTLMIGIQALKRIEALHERGYIHRDIKPENFVLGLEQNSQIIHLIDFGLSIPYLDFKNQHVKFKEGAGFAGTIYYLSVFGHLGLQPSRRDDLISLGYMLLELLLTKLPWDGIKGDIETRFMEIGNQKAKTSPKELCEGLDEEIALYFENVTNLPFNSKPNYDYLTNLFQKVMEKKGFKNDGIFDWNRNKMKNGIDLNAIRMLNEPLSKYIKKMDEYQPVLN